MIFKERKRKKRLHSPTISINNAHAAATAFCTPILGKDTAEAENKMNRSLIWFWYERNQREWDGLAQRDE